VSQHLLAQGVAILVVKLSGARDHELGHIGQLARIDSRRHASSRLG
jgi:hypothetical protein